MINKILLIFGLMSFVAIPAFAISLDDDEEDVEDVSDYLNEAKEASQQQDFSKAKSLLIKAQKLGVLTQEVNSTVKYLSIREKTTNLIKEAQKEADKELFEQANISLKKARDLGVFKTEVNKTENYITSKRQDYKKRLALERKREVAKQQRNNNTSGSSSSVDYVMVNFSSTCGFVLCSDKNLSISGGPGSFSPSYSGAASGSIHKGYNGLSGRYNWSAQLDNKICSGSFYLSGQKRNLYLSVYDSCADAGSNEH